MSIILWIDPGTTIVGFAVISVNGRNREILDYGVIQTTPRMELSLKLLDIERDLSQIIDTYHPEVCGIERLFFFKNQTTVIDVAQSRWVIVHTLAKRGIEIQEYTPLQVKKGICGNGIAKKAQVQNALKIILKLDEIPKPDDAADALALAYITSLRGKSSYI